MSDVVAVPTRGSLMSDIALTGADGVSSTLGEVRDGRPAVVFFMRAATCPVCLSHARAISKMSENGELKGAQFILIAPGPANEARIVQQRLGSARASIWASGENHAAVGLGKFLMLQHSGTFVLDQDGRVLTARTSAMPIASFSRAEVITALS